MSFDVGRRARLSPRDLPRFATDSLFDKVARVLCEADCLPRKELYESWEVARRARRAFRGGRVLDLACGHGLIAHLLLLLDDTSPDAVAADSRLPDSARKVRDALVLAWPRLAGRVALTTAAIAAVPIERGALVVSAHACGGLTDQVITRGVDASARLALLPCCHDEARNDTGGLTGWMDVSLAIDATRVARLRASGYRVQALRIPPEITPKNRLLLAEPAP